MTGTRAIAIIALAISDIFVIYDILASSDTLIIYDILATSDIVEYFLNSFL